MSRWLLVLVIACGGGGESSTPGVASGVASETSAGRVRELTGKVSATRGTATRALEVGSPISPDDMIDTGADGSVVIELAHNNALWSLEAGIKARVDQSVAWGLPKQVAAKPVDHATSSAGRHAEREAANTQVTAAETADRESAKDPASGSKEDPQPAAAATPAPKPGPIQRPAPTTPSPRGDARPKVAPDKPTGGGGGSCDEVSCVLKPDNSACCAKFKKSGSGPANAKPDASLPDVPDRIAIRNGMMQIMSKLRACADRTTAKGTVKLTIKVAPDGKVTSVSVLESIDPAIDGCLATGVKTLALPASHNGVTFTYPINFN